MRTITIIIIILFVAAVVLIGITASKYLSPGAADQTEETNQADTIVEEEQDTAITEIPESSIAQEVPAEESDQEETPKVEIYLDGDKNSGIFLGEAVYGVTSEEASSIYGQDFSETGYLLTRENTEYSFEPGSVHYIYVYFLVPENEPTSIREKIMIPGNAGIDGNIGLSVDNPSYNEIITADKISNIRVSGWSVDFNSRDTTGIDRIEMYLNGPKGFGKFLGEANYGTERQDVANAYGNSAYTNSGYSLFFDGSALENGSENTIYIYSFSTSGTYNLGLTDIIIEGEREESGSIISVEAALNDQSIQVSGWAINKAFVLEGQVRNTEIEYSIKKIIYTADQNGNEELCSINLDGSGLLQLTDHPGKDNYPSVSPDGKKIAYTSDINGTWQIMVMNWDGTGKVQLTNNPWRSGYPTWSFDGRFIYFEGYPDGDWEIYRIDSDGSSLKRLTFNPGIDDWHPDAHPFQYKVIYESGSVGNEDLYIMDYNGENNTKISEIAMRKRVPAMSIDGKIIVFMGYEGNNSVIYKMDNSGGTVQKINGSLNSCSHPDISPDNRYITFDSPDGQGDIYICGSDGSGLVRLTSAPGNDYDPAFLYQQP